jgi:hypothetical protein
MPEEQLQPTPTATPSESQSPTTPETTEPQPAQNASYGLQVFLGILSSWLALPGGAGVIVGIFAAAKAPSALILAGVSLIPLGLGTMIIRGRRTRGPGLGVGFLIGLALMGLAFGLCFASFK